jgi:hypothetical protein
MDAARFDALVRSLSLGSNRRRVLRGVAATVLGQVALVGVGIGGGQTAQGRKRKFKKNRFGCIDVGEKCYGRDGKCCSGICDGEGRRSRCVAHNVGGCAADDSSCPESIPCGTDGECYRTTGKAGFCAQIGTCDCHPCKKDKDCELEFGAGAACIICISNTENSCIGVNGSKGTACVPPATL